MTNHDTATTLRAIADTLRARANHPTHPWAYTLALNEAANTLDQEADALDPAPRDEDTTTYTEPLYDTTKFDDPAYHYGDD